jgi:predicted naringenin-chalcone synthase
VRVVISGIGTAVPPGFATQEQALELMIRTCALTGDRLRFARAIFERSGIRGRASVLCDPAGAQTFYCAPGPPGTKARMDLYAKHAPALAQRACEGALGVAGCAPGSITHIVTASCTGFGAPGVDVDLVERLGLRPDVRRIHVGFMGCHAAINALTAASALARAGPLRSGERPRVLVACVELSSIHLQPSDRPDHIVAGALFGDGAGACVVDPAAQDTDGADGREGSLELIDTASTILPGSRDAMSWNIGDTGFAMTLAESVPGLVREHLRPWLASWLESATGTPFDPASLAWCVHPGGPRVLEAVGDAAGLDPAALRFSREVLRDYGNMSSPTILFILQRMLEERAAGGGSGGGGGLRPGTPVVMLAFGPGLALEGALARVR